MKNVGFTSYRYFMSQYYLFFGQNLSKNYYYTVLDIDEKHGDDFLFVLCAKPLKEIPFNLGINWFLVFTCE